MAFKNFRLATIVGLAALSSAAALSAQSSEDEAANAAAAVAAQAEDAIRAIDPTTGGASLVVDPSLPQPYGFDTDVEDLPELPPAPTFDAPTYDSIPGDTLDTPRGPAASRRARR